MAKVETVLTRRFDSALGGLGFSEFVILLHLHQAKEEKMRRVDLAEKIGLTQSGVTRLLAPMEKVGLIKRLTDSGDARVSFVALAQGGKRRFTESLEEANLVAEDLFAGKEKNLVDISSLLAELGGSLK